MTEQRLAHQVVIGVDTYDLVHIAVARAGLDVHKMASPRLLYRDGYWIATSGRYPVSGQPSTRVAILDA